MFLASLQRLEHLDADCVHQARGSVRGVDFPFVHGFTDGHVAEVLVQALRAQILDLDAETHSSQTSGSGSRFGMEQQGGGVPPPLQLGVRGHLPDCRRTRLDGEVDAGLRHGRAVDKHGVVLHVPSVDAAKLLGHVRDVRPVTGPQDLAEVFRS